MFNTTRPERNITYKFLIIFSQKSFSCIENALSKQNCVLTQLWQKFSLSFSFYNSGAFVHRVLRVRVLCGHCMCIVRVLCVEEVLSVGIVLFVNASDCVWCVVCFVHLISMV